MNGECLARIKDGTADQSRGICHVFGTVYIAGIKRRRKASNLIFTAFRCFFGNGRLFHLDGRRHTNRRRIVFGFADRFLNIFNGRCDIQCDSLFGLTVYKFSIFHRNLCILRTGTQFFTFFLYKFLQHFFVHLTVYAKRNPRFPGLFYFFIIFDQISFSADFHRLIQKFFRRKCIPHFCKCRRHNTATYFNL
ncbi:unknown [Roseburia sp. CAG:309]|nr:unknown [Roseburia sp. CAG:309]